MTNYEKGRRQEWAIVKWLQKYKYLCVRSAGSKSPIDILAINGKNVLCIQSKASKLSENAKEGIKKKMQTGAGYRFLRSIVVSKDWQKELEDMLGNT